MPVPSASSARFSFRNHLVVGTALLVGAVFLLPSARMWLDNRLQSALLAAQATFATPLAAPITLVAIDEASIDTLGPWPWPRATWAELLDRLRLTHRPTVVALDVVFPPDQQQLEGNLRFARSLARNTAIIGQLLLPEPGIRGGAVWANMHVPDDTPSSLASAANDETFAGLLGSESVLAATAGVGHINAYIDHDGAMRRVPTLLCAAVTATTCSISFVQAVIGQLTGTNSWHLRRGHWNEAEWMLEPGDLAPLALPVDHNLRLIIPWRHPSHLRQVSVADIWQNRLPAGLLDQDILLFGGTSLGLGDTATSPLGQTVPGVEVHGLLLRNWLSNSVPYQPRYATPLMWSYVALLALLFMLWANNLRYLRLLAALGVVTPLAFASVAWFKYNAFVPAAAPAAFAFLGGGLLLIRCALRDRTDLIQVAATYLPSPLRRLLNNSGEQIPNEVGWGTVMMADILGYTRQSQVLPLKELAQWCDLGIDHVVQEAQARGAMLDNVAGDGALLLWRSGSRGEQADAALECARAILANLPQLNEKLQNAGLPPLALGIGIHAGPYLLGSFGKGQKRYTIVSEAANLASHIERQTRQHPWPVLISETVAHAVPTGRTHQVAYLPVAEGSGLRLYTLANEPGNQWPSAPYASTAATAP